MEDYFSGPIWEPASLTAVAAREESTTSSISGSRTPPEKKTRQNMYPKEQWQALKPIIQRLYMDEGQTFTKVAEYLHEHHDFSPTKKQFTRRISEWGFEKNVKRNERRAVLESLSYAPQSAEFEATTIRGRKLDKAKIDRWRKREGMRCGKVESRIAHSSGIPKSASSPSKGGCSASSEKILCNEGDSPENSPHHENHTASTLFAKGWSFNPWSLVDVVGPGGLGELIGALTLDQCEDVPSLYSSATASTEGKYEPDLLDPQEGVNSAVCHKARDQSPPQETASHSDYFSFAPLKNSFSKHCQQWMSGPLDELGPFPNSAPPRRLFEHPRTDHLISECSLKMKGLECRRKIKILNSLERSEVIELVDDMRSIAWRHSELDRYRQAEIWWRRVVTSSMEIRGNRPFKLLHACLQVIESIYWQRRYAEARSLHQGVHNKIMNLVGPDHELAILSRRRLAELRRSSGEHELVVASYRELLQTCLLRHGTKSRATLEILADLGSALMPSSQYHEGETILCIQVQLDCEFSNCSDRNKTEVENALNSMSLLARCLNRQRKYEESKSVLNTAERWFKDWIRVENSRCRLYFYEYAYLLRSEGRHNESAEIFRAIIKHGLDQASINRLNEMGQLADLLEETNQGQEEADWREKIFSMEVEMGGVESTFSMIACKKLGVCYAKQGRYDDAIFHYQQTVEKLGLSNAGDIGFCAANVEKIRDWIFEVEKMMAGTDF